MENLEGKAARDIEDIIPYSYASIALGIACLVDLNICVKDASNGKSKAMRFHLSGAALWQEAQSYLINPVAERLYCDRFLSEEHFPVCGINALAAYTMLNPDPEQMIAMSKKQLRVFKEAFEAFADNYVIIGGTACSIVMTGTAARPHNEIIIFLSHRIVFLYS